MRNLNLDPFVRKTSKMCAYQVRDQSINMRPMAAGGAHTVACSYLFISWAVCSFVSRVGERGPRGGYVLGGWQERSGGVTVSTPTLQTQRAV